MNYLDEVKYWYCKAIEDDNKFALYKLGELYELGKGVYKNKQRAFEFYKKSADLDAQIYLGYCYINGIGTEINKEKDLNYIIRQQIKKIGSYVVKLMKKS